MSARAFLAVAGVFTRPDVFVALWAASGRPSLEGRQSQPIGESEIGAGMDQKIKTRREGTAASGARGHPEYPP